jgi:hypothetical protein
MCFGGILGFIDLLCVASGFLSPIFSSLLPFPFSFVACPSEGKKKRMKEKKERKKIIIRAEKDGKDSLPT